MSKIQSIALYALAIAGTIAAIYTHAVSPETGGLAIAAALGHMFASLTHSDAIAVGTAVARAAEHPPSIEAVEREADRVISFTRSQFVGKSTAQIEEMIRGAIVGTGLAPAPAPAPATATTSPPAA